MVLEFFIRDSKKDKQTDRGRKMNYLQAVYTVE